MTERSMTHRDVVVVGASIAGVATAEGLRRQGFRGSITLVDAEPYLPYDKPPLSKQALSQGWNHDQLTLRSADHYRDLDVELRLGVRVENLDASQRIVTLADGTVLQSGHVVIATGGRARGFDHAPAGVFTLRGRDDAVALRTALGRSHRLTVVGGGFVGAEVAASARQHGLDVTIVEATSLPFLTLLGRADAEALVQVHRRRGVRVRCDRAVTAVVAAPQGPEVVLADGSTVPGDVVVVGLGIAPNTEWLVGSGLDLGDGVLCNAHGATSVTGVWAVGDVAAWPDPTTGRPRRGQHWTGARTQGTVIAHGIAATLPGWHDPERPLRPPPVGASYFWSDWYDLRLQCFGDPGDHDSAELVWGAHDDEKFVTTYHRDGELIAVLGVNAAREIRPYRAALEQRLRDTVEAGSMTSR